MEPTDSPQSTTQDWFQELMNLLKEDKGALWVTTPPPLPSSTMTTTTKTPRHTLLRKGRHRKNGAVRLVGDKGGRKDRGRVEIHAKGEWGTICDDLWDTKSAGVVCRQLGYSFALRTAKLAEFGEGKHLKILLDDVQCEGSEETLLDCQHAGVGQHDCGHHEDAGVICSHLDHGEE